MQAGTVRHFALEGGFFGIVSDSGDELLPVNLPSDLREDGLRVVYEAEASSAFTMHMWGRTVTLTRIERE